jgi:transcription elongation GreA/GreB family factor
MSDPVPITPSGAEKLKEELARLKEERPKISREIGVAREHGDLS